MIRWLIRMTFMWLFFCSSVIMAQNDSVNQSVDTLDRAVFLEYQKRLEEVERQRKIDSIKKVELEEQLLALKTNDKLQKEELLKQLQVIEANEQQRIADKKAQINSLRKTAKAYPVVGPMKDTLLFVYSKIGASTPKERARNINTKIERLYEDDFFKPDSVLSIKSENTYDIIYDDIIIMSISETDALWYEHSMPELAERYRDVIKESILKAKDENSLIKLLARVGWAALVIAIAWLIIWLIGKGYLKLLQYVDLKKEEWLKDLSYKGYTFITAAQELQVVLFFVKVLRWVVYFILLYITLPIIFSIFPFSRDWATALFHLVWSPFKSVLMAVWNYLPNLFSILVIYFVMRYVIRFVRYIFKEIRSEKLKIAGFHADWAMPTYSIVRFLLYAFMFVLIFPLLPSSDSNIFKGVSVFIGILFSLGSSSAIANMVAGLVITYMRPFKIGDRIKINDISGDVIEKTLLVTRVRTIKNEIITIPNSSVLTGNTTNYTAEAQERGLIVHTTITIGYDVPWKLMHEALQEAASRTDMLMEEPKPFVLQTSLDDFYVSYQINAYTREASKQALIYSQLHQHIQDVCNEMGIEILSPHYRAARDGNQITIPSDYLPKDYQAPRFNVRIEKDKEE